MKQLSLPTFTSLNRQAIGAFAAIGLSLAGASVQAGVTTNAMANASWGYKITGLGAGGNETALVFTNAVDKTMTWTPELDFENVRFLVIGGGGSGGSTPGAGSNAGGGGGAGGMATGVVARVTAGEPLSIVVGKGGAYSTSKTTGDHGKSGYDSKIALGETSYVIAKGGGYGGGYPTSTSTTGGSGGSAGAAGGNKANTAVAVGTATSLDGYDTSLNLLNADCGVSGVVLGHNAGEASSSAVHGSGGGGAGAAGTKGPSSVTAGKTSSGVGGDGAYSDITGEDVCYAGGGGGGASDNTSKATSASEAKWGALGGAGGGGQGGSSNKSSSYGGSLSGANGKDNTGGGGGGQGYWTSGHGGNGGSGIVILRYAPPAGKVTVPEIAPKVYTGEPQTAEVLASEGYSVTANAGGTDIGEYPVVLTLTDGYYWLDGSTDPANLVFAITRAQNEWTTDPAITKTIWLTTDDPGELTAGAMRFGPPVATIAKDGGTPEAFGGTLPTDPGEYVLTYTAASSANWTDPDQMVKSVSFEIVSGDIVPPFTVTEGALAASFNEGQIDVSVGYAVSCDVVSPKTVSVYARYVEDGTDVTNELLIAENVALDAVGSGAIPDLKPGKTYRIALFGQGGETTAPMTDFKSITTMGPALDLAASVTFTNDPKEFVITGSVTPGLGMTTVYLRWSLNSDALDQNATFDFQYGDSGAFTNRVAYEDWNDTLTWDVAVSNSVTMTTYGDVDWNGGLAAKTKTRTDTTETTYTWTGAGEDNLWTNMANWTASGACYGYPDSKGFATARFTSSATVDLDDGTFGLAESGIVTSTNLDEVRLRNGQIDVPNSDFGYGANGTTVVFDSVEIKGQKGLKFVKGSTVVFEGTASHDWRYEFWNSGGRTDMKVINGRMYSGYFQVWIKGGTDDPRISISNAVWTIANAKVSLATKMYLRDGDDRQARFISQDQLALGNTWNIEIPESGHTVASIVGKTAASTGGTLQLELKDWKRGKRVPLVSFTGADQTATIQSLLDSNSLKLDILVGGQAESATSAAARNGHLEWDAASNTLYYKQNNRYGFAVIVR